MAITLHTGDNDMEASHYSRQGPLAELPMEMRAALYAGCIDAPAFLPAGSWRVTDRGTPVVSFTPRSIWA